MSSGTPRSLFEERRNQFADQIMATVQLTGAAAMDAARFDWTVNVLDAVNDLRASKGEPTFPEYIAHAKRLMPMVQTERETGFPLFHGLATIGIWAALEAFVEDLLLACMGHDEKFIEVPAVSKLKIPLLAFQAMKPENVRHWILENVEVGLNSAMAPGVGKLEGALDAFGLGGPVDAELRACLVELHAVRNVLVHRGGRADSRLLANCPWLGFKHGDEVRVDQRMLSMYGLSAIRYGSVVYRRVQVRFGGDPAREDEYLRTIPDVTRTSGTDSDANLTDVENNYSEST
jgi:hypothetical protein